MSAQEETELEALRRGLARGVRSVSHGNRTVQYSSAEDMLRRIRVLEARIGKRPKAGLASVRRAT